MKFGKIIKDVFEDQKLQKVRIKVDPMWSKTVGFQSTPNFEGYILQEYMESNMPALKIFIINTPPGYNSIQSVRPENIEKIDDSPATSAPINYFKMTMLKKAILDKMIEMSKDKEDPDVIQVLSSKDIGSIETYLRQMGLSEDDLLNLYRKTLQK